MAGTAPFRALAFGYEGKGENDPPMVRVVGLSHAIGRNSATEIRWTRLGLVEINHPSGQPRSVFWRYIPIAAFIDRVIDRA